jgi:hypothetical protein
VVHEGSAFVDYLPDYQVNVFGYNDRSELTDAERYFGTDPDAPVGPTGLPQDYAYAYDTIGNRQTYTLDGTDVETGTQLVSENELALITRIDNNRPLGRNTE